MSKNTASKSKLVVFFRILLIVAAVVIVAYLAGAVTSKILNNREANQQKQYEAVVKESSQLVGSRKYDEAVKLWQAYIPEAPTDQLRFGGHLQLATVYVNNSQYKEAIEEYKAADAIIPGQYPVLQGIALTADSMGDKATAIEYYKKTIDYLRNSGDPTAPLNIQSYEARIKQLGGTP